MAKKGSTFQTYSNELKIQAVESFLNGEGSQSAIAKKYGLKSRTQLIDWVRKYQETGGISDSRGKSSGNRDFPPLERSSSYDNCLARRGLLSESQKSM
ncbi:transposase [Bacillus cereus]|uniref:transposase n=1 Tax=Bacillus cereus TaxID=1396 RepID=UPI0039812A8C